MAGTPHRHPMLLLDRIESLEPGRRGTAFKAVTAGEVQSEGAPEEGLAPTLLVDALGQLAIVVLDSAGAARSVWYLGSVEAMEFPEPTRPGDVVRMEAVVQRTFRGSSRVNVSARVGDRDVARGVMVLSTGADRK